MLYALVMLLKKSGRESQRRKSKIILLSEIWVWRNATQPAKALKPKIRGGKLKSGVNW